MTTATQLEQRVPASGHPQETWGAQQRRQQQLSEDEARTEILEAAARALETREQHTLRTAMRRNAPPGKDHDALTGLLERTTREAQRGRPQRAAAQITMAATRILLQNAANWPPAPPPNLSEDQRRGFAQASAHQILRAADARPESIRLVSQMLTITESEVREAAKAGKDPSWFDRRSMAIREENRGSATWVNPSPSNLTGRMEMATHFAQDRIQRMTIATPLAPAEAFPEPPPEEGSWQWEWQRFRLTPLMTPLQLAKALMAVHVDQTVGGNITRLHRPETEEEAPEAQAHEEHRARLYQDTAKYLIEDRITPAITDRSPEGTAIEVQEAALALKLLPKGQGNRAGGTPTLRGTVRWDSGPEERWRSLTPEGNHAPDNRSMRRACRMVLQALDRLTVNAAPEPGEEMPHRRSEYENRPDRLTAGQLHYSAVAALSEIADRNRPEAVARWLAHADWCLDQMQRAGQPLQTR